MKLRASLGVRVAFQGGVGGSNPYKLLLARGLEEQAVQVVPWTPRLLLTGSPDVWHLHWPENAYPSRYLAIAASRAVLLLGQIALARLRGVAIVWTVHNLKRHDAIQNLVDIAFFACFTRLLSGWIALSQSAHTRALQAYPPLAGRPSLVTRHGVYAVSDEAVCPPELNGEDLRGTILVFGTLRPYKGIDVVLDLIPELGAESRVSILIAGEFKSSSLLKQAMDHADATGLTVLPRRITDAELRFLLRNVAGALFPYKEYLNSGAMLYALSHHTIILVPMSESSLELQADVGERYVVTYGPTLSVEILQKLIKHEPSPAAPDLSAHSWRIISAAHADFYSELVTRR